MKKTKIIKTDLVVLGSGPGGYTAAFRAADLGLSTVLIERHQRLGGVCLNVGCIPSKTLLHAARVMSEAEEISDYGISFPKPSIDMKALRGRKEDIVSRLTTGLAKLAKARKVQVVIGEGIFQDANSITVSSSEGEITIRFDKAIIATGSSSVTLPFLPDNDPRIMDSTGALELTDIPERLLILGGSIIGLEMATVYDALGSRITIVEMMDQIIPRADKEIVKPLHKRISKRYDNILLNTKVTAIDTSGSKLIVRMENSGKKFEDTFDRVIVAIGRRANTQGFGLKNLGLSVDANGFIPVDNKMQTLQRHIFAIGDVVGQPMLAHKAVHEGKVVAEVASGDKVAMFDARVIPSVAYTDPEVAWVGLSEAEAKAECLDVRVSVFPWAVSGRALSVARHEGITKLVFDNKTKRLLGAAIVGVNAGELIAEAALAIEMNADATDILLTIHPHPTLSETLSFAAEMFEGTITDLMPPK